MQPLYLDDLRAKRTLRQHGALAPIVDVECLFREAWVIPLAELAREALLLVVTILRSTRSNLLHRVAAGPSGASRPATRSHLSPKAHSLGCRRRGRESTAAHAPARCRRVVTIVASAWCAEVRARPRCGDALELDVEHLPLGIPQVRQVFLDAHEANTCETSSHQSYRALPHFGVPVGEALHRQLHDRVQGQALRILRLQAGLGHQSAEELEARAEDARRHQCPLRWRLQEALRREGGTGPRPTGQVQMRLTCCMVSSRVAFPKPVRQCRQQRLNGGLGLVQARRGAVRRQAQRLQNTGRCSEDLHVSVSQRALQDHGQRPGQSRKGRRRLARRGAGERSLSQVNGKLLQRSISQIPGFGVERASDVLAEERDERRRLVRDRCRQRLRGTTILNIGNASERMVSLHHGE
mmetsp:Transcript_166253/g.533872  ORF Transcript_166253/g.533872 Transcript_166253/m.533872 type:complete len:409 (-) Transcript_166253:1891-3117(-)